MSRIDFGTLTREERSLLIRFVCSFAWADSEIRPEERALVSRFVHGLGLDEREAHQADAWLERPPEPASLDPAQIPPEQRAAFLYAVESMVGADIDVAPEEREALRRLLEGSR